MPTLLKARERVPLDVSFCLADVRHLPLPPSSFDGALCFGVFQAISEPSLALDELATVLRPGASLWIDALNRYCLPTLADLLRRRISGRKMHLRYDGPFALRDAFRAAGFSQVRIDWVPIVPQSLHFLQRVLESAPLRLLLRYCAPLALLVSHAFVVSGRRSISP